MTRHPFLRTVRENLHRAESAVPASATIFALTVLLAFLPAEGENKRSIQWPRQTAEGQRTSGEVQSGSLVPGTGTQHTCQFYEYGGVMSTTVFSLSSRNQRQLSTAPLVLGCAYSCVGGDFAINRVGWLMFDGHVLLHICISPDRPHNKYCPGGLCRRSLSAGFFAVKSLSVWSGSHDQVLIPILHCADRPHSIYCLSAAP